MLPFIKLIVEHKTAPGTTPTPIPSLAYPSEMYYAPIIPSDMAWTLPVPVRRTDVITSQKLPDTAIEYSVSLPEAFIFNGQRLYFNDLPDGTWVGPGYWFFKIGGFLNRRGTWG